MSGIVYKNNSINSTNMPVTNMPVTTTITTTLIQQVPAVVTYVVAPARLETVSPTQQNWVDPRTNLSLIPGIHENVLNVGNSPIVNPNYYSMSMSRMPVALRQISANEGLISHYNSNNHLYGDSLIGSGLKQNKILPRVGQIQGYSNFAPATVMPKK